jgi:hypothetical protein
MMDLELGQGGKNEHSHSYVRIFATQERLKRHLGLPVGLGLTIY